MPAYSVRSMSVAFDAFVSFLGEKRSQALLSSNKSKVNNK